jgi:hypothetical protein
LIHALYDTAKVAVVRFVKKMNDRPLLGILIPVVKADVEAFYFNQLPFEEDIRESVERAQHRTARTMRGVLLFARQKTESDCPSSLFLSRFVGFPFFQLQLRRSG